MVYNVCVMDDLLVVASHWLSSVTSMHDNYM